MICYMRPGPTEQYLPNAYASLHYVYPYTYPYSTIHQRTMGTRMGKMPRQTNRLAARAVTTTTKPGLHADGGGLYLQVTKAGAKSWIYRFALNKRTRDMGLGPLQTVSLADARDLAGRARALTASGIDPIVERDDRLAADAAAVRHGTSFGACAEEYIRLKQDGWKNAKHRQQWPNTLKTYVYPVIGDKHVRDVSKRDIVDILEPIWTEKPETARRVRSRIEIVIDMAIAADLRESENPARLGVLKFLLPSQASKSAHHPALPYDQISGFVADLRKQEGIAALALEFIILTATRTSETLNARWSEIDNGIWTISGDRMKSGREHRVPLSDRAVKLLETLPRMRGNDHVFPGQKAKRPLSNMACLVLLKRMARDDLTVHGFRSTFRDWCAEQTDCPRDVAEMALAHSIGNKVEAAYRRGDLFEKRRGLMEAWADYCGGQNA
jgi:integrase